MLKYLIKNNKFHAITGLIALIVFSLNKFLLSILILFDLAVANGEIFIDFRYVILINGLYILYYFIFNYFSEFLLDKFMIKSQNVLNQRVFNHIVTNYKQI